MNQRKFLASTFAASLAIPSLRAFDGDARYRFSPQDWRQFRINTRVTLPDAPGPAQLWVPLAQTAGDYQMASGPLYWSDARAKLVYDSRYGVPIMRMLWDEKDRAPRTLEVQQYVAARNRRTSSERTQALTEAERQFWTASTANIPIDGILRDTATRITAGEVAPVERLRAIYHWVVEHTRRDPDVPGCGRRDIKTMLELGRVGGKCADINGLMVGLARAAGFPAREVYGIRVAPSKLFPSLGASGDLSKAQHCRAETFVDGHWLCVDPADVRKVILAEKLALDSPEIVRLRDDLFGDWEANWIGYNSATDIELPCDDGKTHRPEFPFLMYPCALTPDGELPCLDPAKFRYEITAQEVTV